VARGAGASDETEVIAVPAFRAAVEDQQIFCDNIGDNCTLLNLTELGIFGNGHVVMVEKNNRQVADLILDFLHEALGRKGKG